MTESGRCRNRVREVMGSVLALMIVTVLAALTGCGGEARGAGDAVVRDSAGVTIVENQPDADVPAWSVSAEPILEIGGDVGDPEQELYRVRGAVRFPDGRVVVANGGTQELRFYAADGAFLRAAGGEGGGPGEFQRLYFLEILGGDSLLTFDFGNRRASVFDAEGEYGRSFPVELPGEGPSFPRPEAITGPEGRRLVIREGSVFGPGELQSGLVRDSVRYHLMDPEGALLGSLGRFPGRESWVRIGENTVEVRTLPVGRSPRISAGSSGFYYGSTDTYDIGRYGLDGALHQRVRLLGAARPVTEADIEAYRSSVLEEVPEERRPDTERTLREMPYPETMPAHGELHVDALDHLWVQDYRPLFEPGPDRWRIFDAEGRQVATAELPAGFTVYEIGEDFLLGSWQDELDLEYVRMYRLERNGEGS